MPSLALQLQSVFSPHRRRKLEVPDHGAWLVDDPVAALPQPQTVINFFVVGRSKFTIEAARTLKKSAWCQEKRRGAVIDRAAKLVWRTIWMVTAAISQAGSIAPNHRTGFLQTSVGKNEFRAHGADGGTGRQGFHRRGDSSRKHPGIAIEE